MFEEYLYDADYFLERAIESKDNDELSKRYFRASIFSSFGAIEAYINFIGITLELAKSLQPYEIALLTDKRFEFNAKEFVLTEKSDFRRLEDKLKFIIHKFLPNFDYGNEKCWSSLKIYKTIRDELTHPRNDEDERSFDEYKLKVEKGLTGIIDLMNKISVGIFEKPLRKKILELSPNSK